jgi:hypothetical protein
MALLPLEHRERITQILLSKVLDSTFNPPLGRAQNGLATPFLAHAVSQLSAVNNFLNPKVYKTVYTTLRRSVVHFTRRSYA